MTALIVDDEEDIGQMVVKLLGREGISATYTLSIAEARTLISSQKFDLFFLDLNLSDGTGFDLVPQIKAISEKAKIVIISAYDGVQEIRTATELGITEFIKKPFSTHEVIEAATS